MPGSLIQLSAMKVASVADWPLTYYIGITEELLGITLNSPFMLTRLTFAQTFPANRFIHSSDSFIDSY